MTARTGDVIEQAARVIYEHGDDVYEYEDDGMPRCQCGEGIDGSNLSTDGASHIARALADAGLLRQEPPTRAAEVAAAVLNEAASRAESATLFGHPDGGPAVAAWLRDRAARIARETT